MSAQPKSFHSEVLPSGGCHPAAARIFTSYEVGGCDATLGSSGSDDGDRCGANKGWCGVCLSCSDHCQCSIPVIIKGQPVESWHEVQAIQHQPFIYIMNCGSGWNGDEEGSVESLLEVLSKYHLRADCAPYFTIDPCEWAYNEKYDRWDADCKEPHYVDGDRMYSHDGVVRFSGNFDGLSYAFSIDTNHKPTIDALIAAIEKNKTAVCA